MLTWRNFTVVALASGVGADCSVEGQDFLLASRFREVYRVGGFDAPSWAQFGAPPLVSFDQTGRLYALDVTVGEIVVLDRGGQLVQTIGRKGEGPGEFQVPKALAVWPDGRLAVADAGHNAYQVFAPDGEFDRFVRAGSGMNPLAGVIDVRSEIRPDPLSGTLVAQGSSAAMDVIVGLAGELLGEQSTNEGGVSDRGLERLDIEGDAVIAEVILEAWRPAKDEAEARDDLSLDDLADPGSMVESMLRMMVDETPRFEPRFLWDVLPGGRIVYSDSTSYQVKLADRRGRVTTVIGRAVRPVSVTRRIQDAVRTRELKALEEGSGGGFLAELEAGGSGLAERMREAMREGIRDREFYAEIPVLVALRTTWDGALWIQRISEESWDSPHVIDIMRVDGVYVGTLGVEAMQMPSAFGPDGLVAFVEVDELDIPTIVVKRLPPEVR